MQGSRAMPVHVLLVSGLALFLLTPCVRWHMPSTWGSRHWALAIWTFWGAQERPIGSAQLIGPDLTGSTSFSRPGGGAELAWP